MQPQDSRNTVVGITGDLGSVENCESDGSMCGSGITANAGWTRSGGRGAAIRFLSREPRSPPVWVTVIKTGPTSWGISIRTTTSTGFRYRKPPPSPSPRMSGWTQTAGVTSSLAGSSKSPTNGSVIATRTREAARSRSPAPHNPKCYVYAIFCVRAMINPFEYP